MRKIVGPQKKRATRLVTKFLWMPKTINNEKRWLERASWVEKSVRGVNLVGDRKLIWWPQYWANEQGIKDQS